MSPDLILVLVLLAACIGMFIAEKPRMDAVALFVIVALPCTGILSVSEALAGFGDPNVVLIAALFVIGEGLVRTGIAHQAGLRLIRLAGKSEARLLTSLMLFVAGLGAFMSSTGVVAIFLPVVLRISDQLRIPPGRLMMSLSFAGLMSGMLTLVATPPNMIVDGVLTREGYHGFGFFSFTPVGAVVLLSGVGYMLIARRMLGGEACAESVGDSKPSMQKFIRDYRLEDRTYRLLVSPSSPLVGCQLRDLDLRRQNQLNVVGIERRVRFHYELIHPTAHTPIRAHDVLIVTRFGAEEDFREFARAKDLDLLRLDNTRISDPSHEVGLAEITIPPESSLIGKSVVENEFRRKHRLHVIGLRHAGTPTAVEYSPDEKLRLGDVLLVIGPWKSIRLLQSERRHFLLLSLPAEMDYVAPARRRAPYALLSLVIMVVLMITGVVPNVLAALIACLLMGLFRCIDMESAYKSIHWQSIILIVGMLPFATALQKLGGIDLAVDGILAQFGAAGPRILLAGLFAVTAVVGLFISNTATAVLMAPVAVNLARHLDVSPYPFAMTVAIAASAAFMTPVSSPVNMLVLGPGRYRFVDFVKIGVPFTLWVSFVTVLLVPWLFPF